MERLKENLSFIIMGLMIVFFGLLLIISRESLIHFLLELIQLFLLVRLVWEGIKIWQNTKGHGSLIRQFVSASKILIIIILGILISSLPDLVTSIVVYAIGFYQFIIGMVGIISYSILVKDKVNIERELLLIPLIHLIFGLSSFISPLRTTQTLLRLGIYLIFVGVTFITDGSRIMISRRYMMNKLTSRIRVPLPVVLEAIIPNRYIVRFNRELREGFVTETLNDTLKKLENDREISEESIVYVLIQSGDSGFDKIGHVDISYNGKVYSYGNHDVESYKLFGAVGDGVLIEADEARYLDYLKSRRVTVFRFGIVLDPEEMRNFQKTLTLLLNQTTPWQLITEAQKTSFMGRIMASANGKGYKFEEGRYKTYFVLGTNCVLLVDELLGQNGINIINLSGILSPGSYFEYFNRLFQLRGSKVISKTLVHPKLEVNMTKYNLA
ncbi:hypothetical protein ACF3NG_03495 [Aerococcaceae bacterium WGS1372]